jgi:hypothetical protein
VKGSQTSAVLNSVVDPDRIRIILSDPADPDRHQYKADIFIDFFMKIFLK